MEPHTHTKRHAGNFLWSWQAEWLAGACAVHTYVRTSHFMTFLHETNFHPAYCQWHGKLDVSFAFFELFCPQNSLIVGMQPQVSGKVGSLVGWLVGFWVDHVRHSR